MNVYMQMQLFDFKFKITLRNGRVLRDRIHPPRLTAYLAMLKELKNKFLDPPNYLDPVQTFMGSSLFHALTFYNISRKSVESFLSNPAYRQTEGNEDITSLVKVITEHLYLRLTKML